MIALVGDTAIAYDDLGIGMPVVFLHAFPLDRTMWAPQTSALVAGWRCIAPDFRGFGESTSGKSEPASMDRYASDVIGVLDTLRVERAVFVGLSMGGYVAFSIWRQHRSRVRALALADTKAGADDQTARTKRDELIDVARTKGSEAVAGIQVSKLVGKSTQEKHPDIYDAANNLMAVAPADGVIAALRAMKDRPDSTPILSTIDVPTLILVGDEDVVTPVAEARAMHASIAGSRLEVLAGVGHLSSLERPAAFNTVLAEFLSSLELS